MIILIGGSSHVGKTLLAQKLLEKYKYPYVSLDHLKMGFIRTGKTELTVEDDYEMRYFLWPFVAEMIKTAVENKQNMIVEGCYIPGEWKEKFDEEYLNDIRCIFITMSEKYIRQNIESIKNKADVIERRIEDDPDMERLIYCSEMFRNECRKYGIANLDIGCKYDVDEIVSQAERLLELT